MVMLSSKRNVTFSKGYLHSFLGILPYFASQSKACKRSNTNFSIVNPSSTKQKLKQNEAYVSSFAPLDIQRVGVSLLHVQQVDRLYILKGNSRSNLSLAKDGQHKWMDHHGVGLVFMQVARPPNSNGNVDATKWNLHFY